MLQTNRSGRGNGANYRYGFQGQEGDDEIKGNSVNYKYRMADVRLNRFFATDLLEPEYLELTPYQFSSNRLIDAVELEGLEESVLSSVEYSNRPSVHQLKRGDTYWSIAAKLDNVSSDDLIRWNTGKPKNQLHKYIGSYIHTSNPEGVTIGDISDDVLNEDFRFQLSEESQQKMVNDIRTENMLDFAFNFGWFFTGMTAGAVAPPARPEELPFQ
ncbi:MAG: LysM peptidoglycan-binding domain-containing protein [Flavobacteriales bacterium]|jgi:hypothetical protein|nr:LysM peptidoglycan-binding domain-containing protein [Flavobacteriales bacterium]